MNNEIPPFDFDTEIPDNKRLDWIRDLVVEYAEKPDKHQYMMDQILRLACGSEDLYNDIVEIGFGGEWAER